MNDSTRVVYNVAIQYGRTIFTVLLALYTSRIVIDALGEVDFGIYSLLFGLVFMIAFIQSSLSSTTQRFLSFYSGANNREMQSRVFQNSLFLHIFASVVLVIILLGLLPFLFNGFLNIPHDRIEAAKISYLLMLLMLFLMMISTPFVALLISRENILYFSMVMLIISFLKVPLAISLYYVGVDKLVYYASFMLAMQMLDFTLVVWYCRCKYFETQNIKLSNVDKSLLAEIFAFMGWSVYDTFCVVGRTQGLAVVLNRYFGPIINTSYSIAWQVSGQLNVVSSSIYNAIKPQISKNEGAGDRGKMLNMSMITCRFSYLMFLAVSVPVVFEMPTLLAIWLKDVPEYAVLFCRFIVLTHLIDQLTLGLKYTNEAVGKIKTYALIVGTMKIANLPISLILLHYGFDVISVMWTIISVEAICMLLRLPVMKSQTGLSIRNFLQNVVSPNILPTLVSISMCFLVANYVAWEYRFIISGLLSLIFLFVCGLNRKEIAFIFSFVKSKIKR